MSTRSWFAVAAIGRDRPGIVADLSECVYECGCNLEDASMTMLGNEFATLMVVSGTGDDVRTRLEEASKRLEWERRLTVFLRELDGSPEPRSAEAFANYNLAAVGVDKAGIVAGVSRCLADFDILITDLRGTVRHVPQAGTPLYTLSLRMLIPRSVEISEVEQALEAVAASVDVEINLDRAPESDATTSG